MAIWNWFSKTEDQDRDGLQDAISEYEKAQTQKNILAKKSKRESRDLLDTVNGALDILNKVEAKRKK